MNLTFRYPIGVLTKFGAAILAALASVSANAFTLNLTGAIGTTTASFASASAFDVTGSASVDFGSLLSFTLTGPKGTTTATAVSPGNLVLSGSNFAAGFYTISIVGGAGGQYDASFTTLSPAVPEPETYALMMAGLGVVGFIARRRPRN